MQHNSFNALRCIYQESMDSMNTCFRKFLTKLKYISEATIEFQEECEDTKFVIIDETSMIGLKLFMKYTKDRGTKATIFTLEFGNFFIHLVGNCS